VRLGLGSSEFAKQKYPERREIVDALPYTAAGKIRKNCCGEQIAERIAHATAS